MSTVFVQSSPDSVQPSQLVFLKPFLTEGVTQRPRNEGHRAGFLAAFNNSMEYVRVDMGIPFMPRLLVFCTLALWGSPSRARAALDEYVPPPARCGPYLRGLCGVGFWSGRRSLSSDCLLQLLYCRRRSRSSLWCCFLVSLFRA